jgi:hypothetical protein
LRVDPRLLGIEPEPGDVETLQPTRFLGIRLARYVDEPSGSVRQGRIELVRVEPERPAGRDGCGARVPDVPRIGVDGDRGRAQRELEPDAVVDRSAVRGDVDRLAVLTRGEPVQRSGSDGLQPAGSAERDGEDQREDRGEKADPPVSDPLRR